MRQIFAFFIAATFILSIPLSAQNSNLKNGSTLQQNDNSFYSLVGNNTIILSIKENDVALCRVNKMLIRGAIEHDNVNHNTSFVSHNRNNDFKFSFSTSEKGKKIDTWQNGPIRIENGTILTPVNEDQNKTKILNNWFTKDNDKYKLSLGNARMLKEKATFLCESSCFKEALMISKLIMKYSPSLYDTYIPLGDAYWGVGDNTNAVRAYKNYIAIMKARSKEYMIPERVTKRVKQ